MEAIWENNPFNEEQELADDTYSKLRAWMDILTGAAQDRRTGAAQDRNAQYTCRSALALTMDTFGDDKTASQHLENIIRMAGGADVDSVHAIGDGPPKAPVHLLVDVPEVLCGVWIRWGVSVNVVRVRMFGSRRPETPKRPPYSILGMLTKTDREAGLGGFGSGADPARCWDRHDRFGYRWYWWRSVGRTIRPPRKLEGNPWAMALKLPDIGLSTVNGTKTDQWFLCRVMIRGGVGVNIIGVPVFDEGRPGSSTNPCGHVLKGFMVEHGIGIGDVVRPPDAMSGHSGTFNIWGTFQRPARGDIESAGAGRVAAGIEFDLSKRKEKKKAKRSSEKLIGGLIDSPLE
ncbi:hypothetical protein B0H14DRAFT_2606456 [Mycena olivaceomarginata]|nr:hypothetical protein B0H14DRAFT_2606456 [Mycena olivaceomarginata]